MASASTPNDNENVTAERPVVATNKKGKTTVHGASRRLPVRTQSVTTTRPNNKPQDLRSSTRLLQAQQVC